MKVSEARKHAAEMQQEATHLMRAASALNAVCDSHKLNNVEDHGPDSEISGSDVGKSLDDQSRKRLQDRIDQARSAAVHNVPDPSDPSVPRFSPDKPA